MIPIPDQMIVSYNLETQRATLTIDKEGIAQVSVLIVQTDAQGETVGIASAQIANPATTEVKGETPVQYTFGVTLDVSNEWNTLTGAGQFDGFAVGKWVDGTPFSWVTDGVATVAAKLREKAKEEKKVEAKAH